MQPGARLSEALSRQSGNLLPWAPVALGLGIGLYFALRWEPDALAWGLLGLAAFALVLLTLVVGEAWRPLPIFLVLAILGGGLAAARTHAVAAPVLGFRYYGPIEGRVVEVDRSASEAVRLTLDRVVLEDVSPARTPERIRISLHGRQGFVTPVPGMQVILTGHLSPPSGPAEPGDFDFRRMAWFERLGGVGYTRTPVLMLAPAEEGRAGLAVHRLRAHLAAWVRARIPGDPGGFAAAVTTGDRSGLSRAETQAMRDANLYHLVAISGMHMGMLVAFVFGLVRTGVALIPPLALRVSSKKAAALVALPVAAFYLALAGRSVSTERAFVMVAVMLVAILIDRRALTMRSVAVAALIVLALRPETLLNPGFQMSFAAVVALVASFELIRGWRIEEPRWRWLTPALMLVFSSAVAGAATAPFAAAHFNRVAHYGIVANFFAVPAMGLVVMPGAVLMAILGPLGLAAPAVWLVETGARWILGVAEMVAGWQGAVSAVPTPPGAVLPLATMGALTVILWQGRGRWVGLAPVAAALVLWTGATRPALLVTETGALLGLMTAEGRALSQPNGDSFAASVWLENDGATRDQEAAFALPGLPETAPRIFRATLGGQEVLGLRGRGALDSVQDCDGARLIVTNMEDDRARSCEVYDIRRLRQTGALAIDLGPDGGLKITTAAELAGSRPWTARGSARPGWMLARLD